MMWPKSDVLSTFRSHAFGSVKGMEWIGYVFMMHLQVFALRTCTHMISSHIATITTGALTPHGLRVTLS